MFRSHDLLAGLAFLYAAEKLYDGDEDDCPQECHHEAVHSESADSGLAEVIHEPTTEHRADDADYNVQDYALLGIRSHEHRRYPSDQPAEYDPKYYYHSLSITSFGTAVDQISTFWHRV